mmetsp:Transcript_15412/g.25682  ORF Transcript_15412/g.25682 Transcript_15412/m.25682 type:complete len:242 (+) Transcript_15412:157-882(+)
MCHHFLLRIIALAAAISSSPASGFAPTTGTSVASLISFFARSTSLEKKNRRFRLDPNHVIVYGWDGEIEEDDTTMTATRGSGSSFLDLNLDYPTQPPASSTRSTLLAERITQDRDRTASLARLAAAFSPPERALNIEHITDVSVVDVTHSHIELAALVCDGASEGCVSLFVPVNFKQECPPVGFEDYDDGLESCIRSNIDALDVEAELALLQKKEKQNEESMGGLFGIYGDSLSVPDDFRP